MRTPLFLLLLILIVLFSSFQHVFRASPPGSRFFHCAWRASSAPEAEESQGKQRAYQVSSSPLFQGRPGILRERLRVFGWQHLNSWVQTGLLISTSPLPNRYRDFQRTGDQHLGSVVGQGIKSISLIIGQAVVEGLGHVRH